MNIGIVLLVLLCVGLAIYITATQKNFCLECKQDVKTIKVTGGSAFLELTTWVICITLAIFVSWLWILLALLVSFARSFSTKHICQQCKSTRLTDPQSKIALELKKQAIQSQVKKCPYCAELIKAEAILCKHCGKELTT